MNPPTPCAREGYENDSYHVHDGNEKDPIMIVIIIMTFAIIIMMVIIITISTIIIS